MRRITYRHQQTLAQTVEINGIGFLTGADVRLRFVPAPSSTGVIFVRTDLGPDALIPATVANVTGTMRRTTLGKPPLTVSLVEHVLAALAGLRIDNCYVEVDAPEAPGLDGSAKAFVELLQHAGVRLQTERRSVWATDKTIVVRSDGRTLALHPPSGHGLRISYLLDYGAFSPICRQIHTQLMVPELFATDVAPCRTFLLEQEARELLRQGIGSRVEASDLLVFGPRGPIENSLRFGNEPARHKILDILGDLSLLGHDLHGHIVAYRSGHPLNFELSRTLHQMTTAKTPMAVPAAA